MATVEKRKLWMFLKFQTSTFLELILWFVLLLLHSWSQITFMRMEKKTLKKGFGEEGKSKCVRVC